MAVQMLVSACHRPLPLLCEFRQKGYRHAPGKSAAKAPKAGTLDNTHKIIM